MGGLPGTAGDWRFVGGASLLLAGLLLVHALGALVDLDRLWHRLPAWAKAFLNCALQPTWYTLGTFAAILVMFFARRFWVWPAVAWVTW